MCKLINDLITKNGLTEKEVYKIVDKLCKSCYGKGYSSNHYGLTASGDFIGEKDSHTPIRPRMTFCDCERGITLKAIIEKNYTALP